LAVDPAWQKEHILTVSESLLIRLTIESCAVLQCGQVVSRRDLATLRLTATCEGGFLHGTALIVEATERLLGGERWGTVASDWNRRGLKTVCGRPWTSVGMRQMLCGARLAGLREHRGKIVAEGNWEAIITKEQHQRLRAILVYPSQARAVKSYLLTGLVQCGLCGSKMIAHPSRDRTGRRFRRYVCCKEKGGCAGCGIHAELLEEFVVEAVLHHFDCDDPTFALGGSGAEGNTVAAIEGKLSELADMYDLGELTRADHDRLRRGYLVALKDAQAARRANQRWYGVLERIEGPLRAAWPGLRFDQRRATLDALIGEKGITIANARSKYFDPARVDIRCRLCLLRRQTPGPARPRLSRPGILLPRWAGGRTSCRSRRRRWSRCTAIEA
jgi:hypothetical protein